MSKSEFVFNTPIMSYVCCDLVVTYYSENVVRVLVLELLLFTAKRKFALTEIQGL